LTHEELVNLSKEGIEHKQHFGSQGKQNALHILLSHTSQLSLYNYFMDLKIPFDEVDINT